MRQRTKQKKLPFLLGAMLLVACVGYGRERPKPPPFKYVGGTEALHPACEGSLEMSSAEMTFKCSGGSITVPYSSILLMQYRPDVSRKVRKMRLKWKVPLPYPVGKENRYFTVVFRDQGKSHVMVLQVLPKTMRPYLAEIDLKTGRRVEVKSYEEYRY